MVSPHPVPDRMTSAERRAGISLASIFGLRMLGLFLVLPVFSVFASGLPGGDNLALVGLALGAFMMVQAVLQVPFGFASDRFGRKPVIVFGLLLFAIGSVMAAWAPDIHWMIAARALQGTGAISAAITALAADLTREQHRTKVMAMIGSTIGLVFAVSLIVSPALYGWIGMRGIFLLIAVLAVGAIPLLLTVVPNPPQLVSRNTGVPVGEVLRDGQLLRLDLGIFALHVLQTAMFLVIPRQLASLHSMPVAEHWKIYLPVVLASFVVAVPAIIRSERKAKAREVFIAAIVLLGASQFGLVLGSAHFTVMVAMLWLFFAAFNILEASMPAMVSRFAPPQAKGTALGVFNTMQALGAATGGVLGGWVAAHFGEQGVHEMAVVLVVCWFAVAMSMKAPPVLAQKEFPLGPDVDIDTLRERLATMPGVREVAVERERRVATLKVNLERWDEAQLRRLIGGEA